MLEKRRVEMLEKRRVEMLKKVMNHRVVGLFVLCGFLAIALTNDYGSAFQVFIYGMVGAVLVAILFFEAKERMHMW